MKKEKKKKTSMQCDFLIGSPTRISGKTGEIQSLVTSIVNFLVLTSVYGYVRCHQQRKWADRHSLYQLCNFSVNLTLFQIKSF